MLSTTKFHEEFEAMAEEVDEQQSLGKRERASRQVKQRVMYPSVDHFLFPEKGTGGASDGRRASSVNPDQDLSGMIVEEVEGDEEEGHVSEGELEAELYQLAGEQEEALNHVGFHLNEKFLSNCLTHVIFVQNEQLLQKLSTVLKDLTTRAIIFANGRDELIYPGIDGQVLNAATAGTPVVVLHHTGGAAEKLGFALQQKRGSLPREQGELLGAGYSIPENVNVDNFLLLSTSSDTVEKVIDKLTLVLSSVQDDEMREVGYLQAEKSRLLQAWHLHTLFQYHANIQRSRARWLYFSLLSLSFVTTCVAVFESTARLEVPIPSHSASCIVAGDAKCVPDGWAWGFEYMDMPVQMTSLVLILTLLPLASACIQSVYSRFNPLSKFASLEMSAQRVRTEIYMYRTRTLDYKPRNRGQLDILKQIERAQEAESQARFEQLALREQTEDGGERGGGGGGGREGHRPSSVSSTLEGGALEREGRRKGDGDGGDGRERTVETRRKIFAENLDRIHSEAMLADASTTSLHKPPPSQYQNGLLASLYDTAHPGARMPQEELSQILVEHEARRAGMEAQELAKAEAKAEAEEMGRGGTGPRPSGAAEQSYTLARSAGGDYSLAAACAGIGSQARGQGRRLARLLPWQRSGAGATPGAAAPSGRSGAATDRMRGGRRGSACHAAIGAAIGAVTNTTAAVETSNSAFIFDPKSMHSMRDDGFALVTAEDYVKFRLEPAIMHYESLSPLLNRVLGRLQVAHYLLTALTTALSLLGYASVVPVPIALMSLMTSVADFEQIATQLRNVNQCKMQLDNLLIYWESLSMVEKRLPANKEYLVKIAEENMNAEVSAFIKSTSRQGKPRVVDDDSEHGGSDAHGTAAAGGRQRGGMGAKNGGRPVGGL